MGRARLLCRRTLDHRFWSSCREGRKRLANRRCCPSALTLSCWARRGRHSMPTHVKFCWCNVEKSLILRTQWTDRWVHGGAPGGGCMSVSSGGADFVSHPPPLMPKLGRGRRHVLGCRGMQKMSRCCCCRPRTDFESQANKRQSWV